MLTSVFSRALCTSWLLVTLAACQTPPPPPPPPAPPPPVAPVSRASSIDGSDLTRYSTAVERTFAEGLDLYDKGEYAAAIKKLQSPEFLTAWPELRVRALKYLAFSYCVTDDLRACQQAFYDAIQVNPQFTLNPSEEGHPIWGPVFQKARSGPPDAPPASKPAPRRGARK